MEQPIDKELNISIKGTKVGKALIRTYSDGLIFLSNFVIDDKYRGKGIGQQALKILMTKYGVNGLTVAVDNKAAKHIYDKFGFIVRGEPYYDENSGETVYYMTTKDAPSDE